MTLLAVLVAGALLLALWAARRAPDPLEYFAAGRRAGAWLVGIAGTAAAVSAFTFVGGPGLFAAVGMGSLWIILSAPLTGALQCWAVGERVVEMAQRHRPVTVPELLELRFGRGARGAAAVVVVVGCIASLAVQAKAAAVLGPALLGVPGALAACLAIGATAAYTASGGMRAGILADAAQGALMAVAATVLAAAVLGAAGGPAAALETVRATRPQLLGSFGTVPPARAASWYLLFCIGTLAQPHYVQKFLFLRSREELRLLPAVLTGALFLTLTVWLGVGLGGAALAARGSFSIAHPDDLASQAVAAVGPWAVALAGVAVLAALMSTAASFLNQAAAAVTRDLPASLGRPPGTVPAARVVTVAVACAAVVVGLGSQRAVALLGVAGWGFFTAALLAPLALGLNWRGARPRGVTAAIVAGATVDLALEAVHSALPAGLEPGLAGAAAATLLLVGMSLRGGSSGAAESVERRESHRALGS